MNIESNKKRTHTAYIVRVKCTLELLDSCALQLDGVCNDVLLATGK